MKQNVIKWMMGLFILVALGLSGCGGGGSSDPAPSNTSTYSIAGTVTSSGSALPGATMNLSGSSTATVATDASGNYTFTGLINGNYTVTPSKAGYTFNPASSAQTVYSADIPQVNFTTATDPTTSTFTPLSGSMNTARAGHTATLLSNGMILVAGGTVNDNDNPAFSSAELYDPATDTWTATGSMSTARAWHSAILLSNGKVLVAGGWDNGNELSGCELYDPSTGTWSVTGSLITGRQGGANMVQLANDKILIAGGAGGGGPNYTLSSAELYDPATGVWSVTGSMSTMRRTNTMTLLSNGKVLVAGGTIKYTTTVHSNAELYDPSTGTWSATGFMTSPRMNGSATLLADGRVLVVGGSNTINMDALASAELYNPTTGLWTATGSITPARLGGASILLPSGNVLVAGGWNGTIPLPNAELYDPIAGIWTATGSMTTGRIMPDTVLLPSGKVLIIGGSYNLNGDTLTSAELYNP